MLLASGTRITRRWRECKNALRATGAQRNLAPTATLRVAQQRASRHRVARYVDEPQATAQVAQQGGVDFMYQIHYNFLAFAMGRRSPPRIARRWERSLATVSEGVGSAPTEEMEQ